MNKLVDKYGRIHDYLRISITDRCNLRCIYCMPAEGITLKKHSDILSFEEILTLVNIFADMGIKKIRLTGGEPLVRKDVPTLIKSLKKINGINYIGMTSNGVLLKNFIKELKYSGLDGINISLDTLNPEKFYKITLRENFYDVVESIHLALNEGLYPVKLNVVVMMGINEDEILNFVEFIKDKNLNLRFIEYMPFKSNGWSDTKFFPYQKIKNKIEEHYHLIPVDYENSGVSKEFMVPGFKGTIGFITSMSEHFCASCSRLRLTADGWFKTCLFYPPETNLKNLLREGSSSEKIKNVIQETILMKKFGHPSLEEIVVSKNNAMIEIGG